MKSITGGHGPRTLDLDFQSSNMSFTIKPETTSGITTSWLPLTTEWTFPVACSQINSAVIYNSTLLFSNDPSYKGPRSTGTCQPSEVDAWWNRRAPPRITASSNDQHIYSVGPLQCPFGYTTATSITVSPGTIEVGCCPR